MKRNRQAMPPCLSMLSQRLWKFCLKLLTTTVSHSCYGDVVGMTVLQDHVAILPFLCYRVLLCGLWMGTWYNCKQCWPFCEYCQWIPSHHFICWSSCTEPQECCCERSEQQQTCLINYWKIYGNYLVQCGISMEILQVMQLMSLYREWGLEGMVCHFTFYTTVDQVPGLIMDGPVLKSSFAFALECPRSAVRKTLWLLCYRLPLTLLLVGEYNPSVGSHTCVP